MKRMVEGDCLKFQSEKKALEISTSIENNTAIMRMSGAVTADMGTDLKDEILAFISMGKHVRLDFAQLEYISSSAQNMLIDVQSRYADRIGVDMEICRVPEKLYAQFRFSRLDTQLRIRREE